MTALIQMFSSNSGKSGGVQEDALLAVSTLIEVLGEGFLKYMDSFKPFLFIGLKNHAEYQVKATSINLSLLQIPLRNHLLTCFFRFVFPLLVLSEIFAER